MLCDHLEGWDREGGRETQEGGDMGIYVYISLTHFLVQQKLTQHCKAIILQLKKKKVKELLKQAVRISLKASMKLSQTRESAHL